MNLASLSQAEYGWPGGDRPGVLEFTHAAPIAATAVVRSLLDDPKAIVQALHSSAAITGRCEVQSRGRRYFAKITARLGYPELEEGVVRFLAAEGFLVTRPVRLGAQMQAEGRDFRVDLIEFLEGEHPANRRDVTLEIAQTLGAMHHALRAYPRAAEIRQIAQRRYQDLAATVAEMQAALMQREWTFFNEQAAWAEQHAEWLCEMAERFSPHFHEAPEAQCLHGQVHPANILIVAGQPAFLDWEECVQTFAPPAWDVAYFVQRFCLNAGWKVEETAAIAAAAGVDFQALPAWMIESAWLSIATLIQQRRGAGVIAPPAEYDKFIALQRQAAALLPAA